MKRMILFLLLIPVFAWSSEITAVITNLLDQLAMEYTEQANIPFYSKQTISIIEIRETTQNMKKNYVGSAVEEILKSSIEDSLVFKLIDRKNLDIAMNEIKLSLSGLTDEKDAPALGKIRGVKLLLDGSITAEGDNFIIHLRLNSVETAEVIASVEGSVPKKVMLTESNQIAYEYVTANGIGLSLNITPSRYLSLNESPPVSVGDDEYHTMAGGGRLTYRLNQKWKFSIDTDINIKDVFYDKRLVGAMQNLTAYDDIFTSGLIITGFWEDDGSFTTDPDTKGTLDNKTNFYSLNQMTANISFMLSYVYSFSQKFNISVGIGPHLNVLRINQTYDNVPILINEGIAFKRYEINMDFLGLGGTANINLEYFVLPRFALNMGISGFYSYIFSKSSENLNAYSPTVGEYYYTSTDFSIESFGLNPFMMPDGRYITDTERFPTNYLKAYMGASIYF